jgi:hypothetical protein
MVAALFSSAGEEGQRRAVVDATLGMGSIWQAALLGGGVEQPRLERGTSSHRAGLIWPIVNPASLAALATMLGCGFMALTGRGTAPARLCIRCGRPFCHHCKSHREGHEYCSQCLHLFVVGDGLAPETKTRKLYEVARFENLSRKGRRLVSLLLPGSAQLLRGKPGRGCLLVVGWLGALLALQPRGRAAMEALLGVRLIALDTLVPQPVPSGYYVAPLVLIAALIALLVWLCGNLWRWRGREV